MCFLTLGLMQGNTQDIHFTSYDFSPLTLNPALAGSFNGSYRVGGIYRDQWRSVSNNGAYSTPTVHVDVPLIKGFRKQDWIGIGAGVYRDQSSTSRLVQTKSFQGLSYHMALDKKQNQILSFGIQNGTGTRSVKGTNLRTETFILGEASGGGGYYNQDDLLVQGTEGTIVDWVGGVTYSSYQRNSSFIRAGLSVGRINRGSQSFAGSSDEQKVKITAFGLYDFPLAGNLFLTPSIMYQRTSNNQALVAQTKMSYLASEAKGIYVNAGLGYRVGDAIQILVGADVKDVKVQLGYDINVNGLIGATNSVGAFELAVSYIGKVYKKPKVDATKVCPRL